MRLRVRRGLRPDGFGLLIATIAVLGTALVLAHNVAYGVKLGWDSLVYINVARNLLAGDGFVIWDGSALTVWPPLYPVLLAVAGLGIFDPHDVAGPLNAVVFGLTIFVVGHYLRERLTSRFLVVWVCMAVPLCFPLVYQATNAMTAPVFILVTTLALICTDKFLSGGGKFALVSAAVFSALAFQQRYIGVVVPAFVGLLLICAPGVALRHRMRHLAVFSLIVGVPMALWMTRNYLAIGHITGSQQPIDYELTTVLRDTMAHLAECVYPSRTNGPELLLPATLVFLLTVVAYLLARKAKLGNKNKRPVRTLADWRSCAVFGGFALTYFACLVMAMMLGFANRGVEQRYVIPLYIPVWIAVALVLDNLIDQHKAMRSPRMWPVVAGGGNSALRIGMPTWPALALMGALSLWIALQVKPAVYEVELANSVSHNFGLFGGEYQARSEILQHIRRNPMAGSVYSNHPELVALSNGGSSHIDLPYADISEEWLADSEEGAHVVWLNDAPMPRSFGMPLLRATPELTPVAEFADGTIFRINKAHQMPVHHIDQTPSTGATTR